METYASGEELKLIAASYSGHHSHEEGETEGSADTQEGHSDSGGHDSFEEDETAGSVDTQEGHPPHEPPEEDLDEGGGRGLGG